MGNKHSSDAHHHGHESGGDHSKPQAEAATPAVTTATADPPLEKCEVVISSTTHDEDASLAQLISDRLKDTGMSVFIGSGDSPEVAKQASKLVVYTKCMVYVASTEAAKKNVGQDLMSLAYISNKPILVASRSPKMELMKVFAAGMKMTLNQLQWVVFEIKEKDDMNVKSLIQHIQEAAATKTEEAAAAPTTTAGRVSRRGARLNTKLRAQSTVKDIGGEELMIDNFWDRNFASEDEVTWDRFEECFRKDYEAQLSRLFEAENIPWLINMLKSDVFENKERITKELFFSVRGDSVERNAFWKVISQIAVEKFNMREVFNMNSSVRLTAIERLSAFQNPAVVEALMNLLDDEDPNVRAVAAISLGRTGITDETVIDRLIELLKDQDRIVRQSACLSLGTMKAVKAIPHIGNIWRNDFISVVRNAARTALENMKIPEAQEVLSVTKVLEEEIAALEGSQAIV